MTTSHLTPDHLTDEQFSDFLADDSAAQEAIAHLVACGHCRAELAELRSAMASFNEMSLAWAGVEAPRRIQPPSRWQMTRRVLPAWSLAAATMVAVAAVGIHHQLGAPVATPGPVVATMTAPEEPTSGKLDEDNRLLMSIDQELNYQAQPSVPVNQLRGHGAEHSSVRQVTN